MLGWMKSGAVMTGDARRILLVLSFFPFRPELCMPYGLFVPDILRGPTRDFCWLSIPS
jgi:hypothetical protein